MLVGLPRTRRISLRLSPKATLHVAVSALFANVIPYLLLSFREEHVSAALAGVLIEATPVITLTVAKVALREDSARAQRWLAFVGVVVVVAPWATPGGSLLGAIGWCFLAAASYAVGYVYVRRFLSPLKIAPVTLATTQLLAVSLVMIPIALTLFWQPITSTGWPAIVAIVLLGALSTGFANILYFRLIRDIEAAGAAAVDYVVPLFATVFGAVVLGEQLTVNVVIGAFIVGAGVALADRRLGSRSNRPLPVQSAEPPRAASDAG